MVASSTIIAAHDSVFPSEQGPATGVFQTVSPREVPEIHTISGDRRVTLFPR